MDTTEHSEKTPWHISVLVSLALAFCANYAFMYLAAVGALGPSKPNWFFTLALLWVLATVFAIWSIWWKAESLIVSCVETALVLAIATLGVCLNLWTVGQILNAI